MDRRMHVQMDGHLRPALLGRLCRRVDLKMYSVGKCKHSNTNWCVFIV